MIKVQGLGRRRADISHDEAIAHHRGTHSQLGLSLGHMARYVLFYFEAAFDRSGSPLPDLPFDMSALEWFGDDNYWANFQQWLAAEKDGQAVKSDEESFLDRNQCFMMPYEEQVIVKEGSPGKVINLLRLLSFAPGSSDEAASHHAQRCVPAIRQTFGAALRQLVVNRITEATCLATGSIPTKPVDVIEIYKFDQTAFKDIGELVRAFAAPAISSAEKTIFAPERTLYLVAEEVVFLP